MTIFALGSLGALAGLISQPDKDLTRPMVFLFWVAANLLILGVAAIGYCAYLVVTGRIV